MQTTERKISELIPAEYNPRQLSDKQFEDLKASLTRFGAVDPAIVNIHPERKDIIVGGHQRLKVAKSLGWETFPCVEVNLTRDQERELNIRLNKNTGSWDWDILGDLFDQEELTEWGFTDDELFGNIEIEQVEAKEDDYEIPDEIETDIVLGDLIEIGEHRLLCGDSTDSDQVAKLMNGEKSELLLTDPPYGIGAENHAGNKEDGWTQWTKKDWDKSKPESGVLQYLCQITDNQIIWGGNYFTDDLPPTMGWLIWDKGQRGFSLADGEMAWTSFNNALRIKEYSRALANREEKNHPTQKPIEIIKWCFEYADRHSKTEIKLVLDCYLGSGSTMVASHQLNRKCYGMELDPKYCQVIVDRMLKLDPSLQVKINGE